MSPAHTSAPPWPPPTPPVSTSGREPERTVRHPVLTHRQETIAAMIAGGLSGRHIARVLDLPLRAVEGHVHLILEVLGLARPEDLTEDAISGHSTSAVRRGDGGPVRPQPAAGPSRSGR